ncbi:MAG: sensor histidine kinase [Oscillospiraceae bacterium]
MKQLYGKLWVKCTAIALLVVFAVLFAAAALGSAYLINYGAYADGGEQVRQIAENNLLQQTNGDGWAALHAWAEDDTVSRNLLRDRYDPLTSNIYFKLTDKDTGEILFSTGALNKDDYSGKASAYYQQDMTTSLNDGSEVTVVYQAYLKSPLAPRDSALYVMTWVERLISARYLLIVLAILLLAVCLFLFIFLLCAMGHKEGVDGIYQCWLNKIPLDLFLALLALLLLAWASFLGDIWYIDFWYYILLAFGTAALALTLLLSVAGRAKAPGFFKNTLIYKVFAWIFRGLGRIPMVWRTMLIWVCWCFVDLYFTFSNSYYYDSLLPAFWVISRAVLTIVILYLASSLRLLQKEGQAIADGQTDYKGKPIPRWLPALKKHEENLQSIQLGIQKAVDEQTRAERMKTELITNVSHDIKTPLTSIVNYVDLLEKEDIQPEKAKEYVDVLNRQAARLKKLTEDLVEASKASSGSLPVHLAPTDVNVLLSQLAGDYLEKLEDAQLEPIFRPAPSQPVIQADGQLLSRVLGNLFSNICKYAMPGTRVYFESAADENTVSLTFKNISKYELNIPAEELMARFVRGDRSRHTEGSGLGLSIAQSLTELQGGTFRLEIDGDLFKAVVTFPREQTELVQA